MASKLDVEPVVPIGRRVAVSLSNQRRSPPSSPSANNVGQTSPSQVKVTTEVEWMRSDYVADKVKEMKLNYPPGLRPRTIVDMDSDEVEKRMLGLPGELQLDKLTTDKYFGGDARDKFFDRYQWLNHQRCITTNLSNEELRHLYFNNEKLDTSKQIPFGPIRSKNKAQSSTLHDEASVAGSHVSAGSSASAFRSRFKPAGSAGGSVQDNDSLRLTESAMRSGMRKEDFQDDLAHPEDSLLSFGKLVDVPSVHGLPPVVGGSKMGDGSGAVADVRLEGRHGSLSGSDSEDNEWDNVSEVTMTEEEVAALRKQGFYKTRSKKYTFEDHPSNLKIYTSKPVSPARGKRHHGTGTGAGSGKVDPPQADQAEPPQEIVLQAPPAVKHAKFEETVDAAVAQHKAEKGREKQVDNSLTAPALAFSAKLARSGSQKSLDKEGGNSDAAAGDGAEEAKQGSKPPVPRNPYGSLRVKYLTPSPLAVPQTNATAFGGRITTSDGIAGTSIKAVPVAAPAGEGKQKATQQEQPAAPPQRKASTFNADASVKAGSSAQLYSSTRRPQTAAARSRTASANTQTTLSAISSRVTTPRKDGGESAGVATETATQRPSTAKDGGRSPGAAARNQLLGLVESTPKAAPSKGGGKATRAQRAAGRATAAKEAGTTDTYSKIILEDLLAKKKVQAIEEDQSLAASVSKESLRGQRQRGDDDSLCTASTVSTIGLGLYLEGLRTNSGVADTHGTAQLHTALNHSESAVMVPITSPRTKYLAGCMREGLNPRASLVLRKNMSKALNLQHHGMGDQMGKLLAESIQGLPHIQSINIADNMLTDVGMGPIILAAVGIPGLLELNLSQNEIGPVAAKALFEYLVSPTCPLERLILRSADVDDFECERFVEAIKANTSLQELDLSNNKIGSAENLNTVMPDLVTGGEALAELLRLPQCRLRTLKVDWNMIRLDGAIDLADSIRTNNTLTYLDLSFNSLSTDGGITLGVSILSNTTLETLILQSNNLDSVATFTICAGVIENRGLKKVVLDGNPIGEQGMKALMLIPMVAGNRVKVTAARCNISIRDPRCWFNFENLIADYDLNMEDGFHRAIAIILLHLIAGHHTFVFTKFLHEVTKGGKVSTRKIDLVQQSSTEASQHFDKRQRFVLDGLLKMKAAASDIQTAIRLFQEVDADNSGELDKSELKNLMSRMGIEVSEKRLTELMGQYDVDQGGKIELHEFLMLLKSQHKEAQARIKELVEAPIMVLRSDQSKQYLPPTKGMLRITVADGFAKKDKYRIMSACDREYISEVTKDMSGASAAAMISSSLQATKLRLDEGLMMAERMLEDCPDKVAAIKKLILQMNDTNDARNLITSLLENDRTEMLRLKRDFGASLRPILGNPNGYYILDLSKEMDRMCLEKLLEISTTTGNKRMEASKIGYGRVGDLSQKGNWSSFRNELLNGEPVTLSPAFAQPIPQSGKLEFDFSGAGRPTRDALAVSDVRVVKILMNNGLLHPHDSPVALYKLSVLAAAAEKTLGCEGRNYYEVQMDRARLIGEHVEQFYEQLHLRSKHFEQCLEKELSVAVDQNGELIDLFEPDKYPIFTHVSDFMNSTELLGPVPFEIGQLGGAPMPLGRNGKPLKSKDADKGAAQHKDDNSGSDSDSSYSSSSGSSSSGSSRSGSSRSSRSSAGSKKRSNRGTKTPNTPGSGSDAEAEEENSEDEDWQKTFAAMKKQYLHKAEEQKPEKKPEKRQNIAHMENPMNRIEGDEFMDRFREQLRSTTTQSGAKAHRIVDLLEDLFARSWIFCRHLVLILECFAANYGYMKQTKNHGTYRVDVVVALFGRIVDLHNFEFVMKILAPSEAACVYCRLGWLNVYNPCKPEGAWELDMARREERVVAKTLCVLATNEPGDNWVYETFRWMRSMESMPGWELTQPWLTEEGMPMRGLVNITYYSGEGVRKKGCRPYVNFRKALLNLVLLNEEEIVSEDMRSKPPPAVKPGDRAFQKHITLFDQYLCPEFVDPNRKR